MKKWGKVLLSAVLVNALVTPAVLVTTQPTAAYAEVAFDPARIDELFGGEDAGHFRASLVHQDYEKFAISREYLKKPAVQLQLKVLFRKYGLTKANLGVGGHALVKEIFNWGTLLERENYQQELNAFKARLAKYRDYKYDPNIVADYVMGVRNHMAVGTASLTQENFNTALQAAMLSAMLTVPGAEGEIRKVFKSPENMMNFYIEFQAFIDAAPELAIGAQAFREAMVRYANRTEQTTPGNGGGNGGGGNAGGDGSIPGGGKPTTQPAPGGGKKSLTLTIDMLTETDSAGQEVQVGKVKSDEVTQLLTESTDAKTFVVPIATETSTTTTAKLDLGVVTATAQNNQANEFVVQAGTAQYNLPSTLIDTKKLTELGTDLKNAEVAVVIAEQPASTVKTQGTVAAKVVDFSVIVSSGAKKVEVEHFGNTYVDRVIPLTTTVDDTKAVGVVVNRDGSVSPVPTQIVTNAQGQQSAVIKRNSNSTYTVIENEVRLQDIGNSWAKANIQLLANKLLVSGYEDGTFRPQGTVTRGEFVSMLARGLGFSTSDKNISAFTDVSSRDWYAGALKSVVEAGIVNGYEDGSFRAGNKITRQDASVLLANVIQYLKLRGDITDAQITAALRGYADRGEIGGYAKNAVGLASSLGILSGNEGSFNPKGNATRAETVIMLERLLKKANFLSN